jgi:hypothetical protein
MLVSDGGQWDRADRAKDCRSGARTVGGIEFIREEAERKAYAAIRKEEDVAAKVERARSERGLEKRGAADETANARAEQWVRGSDDSLDLFRELPEVVRMVAMKAGERRQKADVIAELEVILDLLDHEIGDEKIQAGARSIQGTGLSRWNC